VPHSGKTVYSGRPWQGAATHRVPEPAPSFGSNGSIGGERFQTFGQATRAKKGIASRSLVALGRRTVGVRRLGVDKGAAGSSRIGDGSRQTGPQR
jgi:hypothetical protein